jgi:TonB family protein
MSSFMRIACVLFVLAAHPVWSQSDVAKPPTDKGSLESTAPPPASNAEASAPAAQSSASSPGDSTKLEPIKTQQAVYPLEAARQKLQGQVSVKLLISETGDVESVDVVSGNPLLAKAAVEAVKKWKFKPFIKNGKPVKVSTQIPLDFAFSDKVADTPTPNPSDNGTAAKRMRVSSGVSQGLLVHRVAPFYPDEARRNRVQGTVLLQAVIGTDGRIHQLTVISGPKQLVEAAIGAVQQWRYKPYLFNGEPKEVETQIQVNFTLQF